MALSARHVRFVDEYMLDGNGAAAAVRAGYAKGSAKVTASRLLANANLQAILRERQATLRADHALSRDRIVREILEAVDMARGRYDPGTMIRGLSEIARMLGFYEPDRRHVQLSQDEAAIKHKLSAMSDEELLKVISGQVESAA